MAVSVTPVPNTGLRRQSNSAVPDRGDNFVLAGAVLSFDGTTLTLSGGRVTLLGTSQDVVYSVEFDDRQFVPGSDGELFVSVTDPDPTDAVAQGSIVGPDSPVAADPKLKVGSVDTSADTVTQDNRRPELVSQSLQSGQINASGVAATAVTADEISDDGSGDITHLSSVNMANNGISNPRKIAQGYLFAEGFSGADPDTRLTNALTAASSGDTIYLEPKSYTVDKTVNLSGITLVGTGFIGQGTTVKDCLFDLSNSGGGGVRNLSLDCNSTSDGIVLGFSGRATNIHSDTVDPGTITATANEAVITSARKSNVVIQSGASRCYVSGAGLSVTDNGSGTVINSS
jgi:hypothetical protein